MTARTKMTTAVSTGVVAAFLLVGSGQAAVAKGGDVGGSGDEYFLSDSFSSAANVHFTYGSHGDTAYVGDWDGDGVDTVAVRRGNTFLVRNSNSSGQPDHVFSYGRSDDDVLVGDWDGDGVDTLTVRRGKQYQVKNSLSGGAPDKVVYYGKPDDTVLVGNWNGNGGDTFAVRRGNEYHVKNSMSGGVADTAAHYGSDDDEVMVGDWDGDGEDTFTVRRGITYYVANAIRGGDADSVVTYGRSNDTALVGDWNADGVDSLGVRRAPAPAESAVKSSVAYAGERGHLTNELNSYRSANGQHTLTRDSSLDEIAQGQAEWMAANRELRHNPTYREQMGEGWYTGSEIIVRNTGGMYMTTDAILSFMHHWWRNSPVHNENMLRGTFTHVGTGYYVGDNGVPYGVHVLGGKR